MFLLLSFGHSNHSRPGCCSPARSGSHKLLSLRRQKKPVHHHAPGNDLRVLEDGVPQKSFFSARTIALSIAFLIDVSISQERTLPDEKAAARTFIENVIRSEKDQAAIIPFEGYAHVEQPLTRDVISLYRVLERVEVAFPSYMGSAPPLSGITSGPGTIGPPTEGSTAIWDSVLLTSRRVLAPIENSAAAQSFCLTDGRDTTSRVPPLDGSGACDLYGNSPSTHRHRRQKSKVNKSVLREVADAPRPRVLSEEGRGPARRLRGNRSRTSFPISPRYSPTNRIATAPFRTMTLESRILVLQTRFEAALSAGYLGGRSGAVY